MDWQPQSGQAGLELQLEVLGRMKVSEHREPRPVPGTQLPCGRCLGCPPGQGALRDPEGPVWRMTDFHAQGA